MPPSWSTRTLPPMSRARCQHKPSGMQRPNWPQPHWLTATGLIVEAKYKQRVPLPGYKPGLFQTAREVLITVPRKGDRLQGCKPSPSPQQGLSHGVGVTLRGVCAERCHHLVFTLA